MLRKTKGMEINNSKKMIVMQRKENTRRENRYFA